MTLSWRSPYFTVLSAGVASQRGSGRSGPAHKKVQLGLRLSSGVSVGGGEQKGFGKLTHMQDHECQPLQDDRTVWSPIKPPVILL